MEHRSDIDGLRAIAVLAVLLYHFKTGIAPGGFIGVDVFFVISGFVITGSILNDIKNERFSAVGFYCRRIRRIVPAYAALVLITTVVSVFVLLPKDLSDYGYSVISTSTFSSNIYFWNTTSYFQQLSHSKPLLHTWSLSVEEQFYLFIPLLLYLTHRYCGQRHVLFVVPLLVISLGISIAAVFIGPSAGFYLLPSRAWELLVGVLLALSKPPAIRNRALLNTLSLVGLAGVLSGMALFDDTTPFPGWSAMLPCASTALLIYSGTGTVGGSPPPLANRMLSIPLLTGIGLISYSLYLVHWPVTAFAEYVQLRYPTPLEAMAMMAFCLGVSFLSWRYIERPLRRVPIEAHTSRLLVSGALAVCFLGVVLGAVLRVLDGIPQRFPDYREIHIQSYSEWGGAECFNQNPTRFSHWNPLKCTRIRGTGGRILLWGDSFAAQYTPGILRDGKRINADVLQYTFAGCPPILSFFSYDRVGCSKSNGLIVPIIKAEHIDTVVLAARWLYVPRATLARLADTIRTLQNLGVRVYVIGQSPEFPADVQQIDYISGSRMHPGKAYWTVLFDPKINDFIRRSARGAIFIDPMQFLCAGNHCLYRDGPAYYYSDYGHFTWLGSLRAVRAYFPSENARTAAFPKPNALELPNGTVRSGLR